MASHGMSSIFQIPTRCYTMFYMVHIILMITACTGLWNITLRCLGSPALHGLDPTSRNGLECPCIQPSQGQTDSLGLQTSGNSKGLLHLKKNKHLHIFQSKCPRTSAIYSMHRQTNQGWKRWRLASHVQTRLCIWKIKVIWAVDALLTYLRAGSWLGRSYQQSILWFFAAQIGHVTKDQPALRGKAPSGPNQLPGFMNKYSSKKKSFPKKGLLPISENVAA